MILPYTLYSSYLLLFLGLILIIVSSTSTNQKKLGINQIIASSELWGLACYIFLIVVRLKALVLNLPFNPDEGMFISGVLRLEEYPVFWSGLDGYSSGPLNYYPLLILKVLGIQLDYTLLHFFAITLIASALYLTVKAAGGSNAAKLIAASAAIIISSIPSGSFQSYASELPSMVIFAGAAILLFKVKRKVWQNILLGLVLGLIPFAKLQGVPIALAMAACALWQEIQTLNWRQVISLSVGGLAPTALVLSTVYLFGFWDDFIQRYILNNLAYTQYTPGATKQLFFLYKPFPLWIYVSMGIVIGLVTWKPAILLNRRCIECLVILSGSLIALLAPGNTFDHYTFYLIVPWILLLSYCALTLERNDTQWTTLAWCSFAVICLVWPYPRIANPDNVNDKLVTYTQVLKQELQIEPNATLGVWGFAPSFYIEWNAKPFSKDTATGNLISKWPYHEKLREEYKLELESNPPKYYVEALDVNNRESIGIKTWPWFEKFLESNYKVLLENSDIKIFKRN